MLQLSFFHALLVVARVTKKPAIYGDIASLKTAMGLYAQKDDFGCSWSHSDGILAEFGLQCLT